MTGEFGLLDQHMEDFLSVFEAEDKRQMIEYSKYLSSLDADVIILMARKAACCRSLDYILQQFEYFSDFVDRKKRLSE